MLGFSLTALRQRLFTRLSVGIGGLLALCLASVQTIIAAMPSETLPSVAPGEPIEAGRWRVALHSAAVSSQVREDGYRAPPGMKTLAVDIDILNRTAESSNVYARIFTIDPPIPGLKPEPIHYLMRDRTILSALHPGLPERVRVIWAVPNAAPIPDKLRLTVTAESFKPRDNLLAAPGWFNPKVIAAVSLPLREDWGGGGAAP
jgi:hypothetical protein